MAWRSLIVRGACIRGAPSCCSGPATLYSAVSRPDWAAELCRRSATVGPLSRLLHAGEPFARNESRASDAPLVSASAPELNSLAASRYDAFSFFVGHSSGPRCSARCVLTSWLRTELSSHASVCLMSGVYWRKSRHPASPQPSWRSYAAAKWLRIRSSPTSPRRHP